MKRQNGSLIACCVFVLGWTLSVSAIPGAAVGQSSIVFMTSDDLFPGLQSRLHRFDAGVETFANDTGAPTAFQGVTIHHGEVLVADYIGEQIQRFSPNGTYLGGFASIVNPVFLESDSSGNVYMTHSSIGPSVATRYSSTGSVTQTYSHATLGSPRGVDADAAGSVYIADGSGVSGNELIKFSSDGNFLNSISIDPIQPFDLAIDEASSLLYLADQGSRGDGIKVFDISGAMPSLVGSVTTPANSVIVGVHFAAESGNILAVDSGLTPGTDPRGLEYSPGGMFLREYLPSDAIVAWDITTIPEPSSCVLVMLGMLGAMFRRPSALR